MKIWEVLAVIALVLGGLFYENITRPDLTAPVYDRKGNVVRFYHSK